MTDSERLQRMERLVEAIAKKLCIELDGGANDDASFERAVAELAAGNRKALSNYVKRGGRIPP